MLILAARAVFLRKEDVEVLGRRLPNGTVRHAVALLLLYLGLFLGCGLLLHRAEGLPLLPCLFETASAIGTVGLTLGITGSLGPLSRSALIVLMFFGRVGGLTLIHAFSGLHPSQRVLPHYDVCFVAIGDEFQSSLETTSLLKELGAKKVVSRASRDVQKKFLLRNGADEVVYPEKQLAAWTALRYTTDGLLDLIELDQDHAIYELAIPADWDGRTVGELDIRKRYGLNILGIRTGGALSMAVGSDTLLRLGQSVLLVGKKGNIQKIFRV